MQIVKAGLVYFALVFAAGFVLGTVRTLWVVARLGERIAELIEMPVMFVVTILAARWTVRGLQAPSTFSARIGVGLFALGLLLATEFTVVLRLRGLTLNQYFASRDPVAGMAYMVMPGVFGIMPLFVVRR